MPSPRQRPRTGVVQKVLFSGYTGSRQSRANQGLPCFGCYPDLNHAAFWPNGHLKRDATTNTLISYGYSGIWWRLLHNTVNAYHSRLKEWLRPFHGVATKNLPNDLGWRRTLEALGPKIMPEDFIFGAIGFGPYQQSTR